MYIKKVKKKNAGYDKEFTYCHLVENVRTDKGPRQRLILNLGKLDLPEKLWPFLANRIEALLTGQGALFETNPKVEKVAQLYKDRIIKKRQKETPSDKKEKQYVSVNIESVSASCVRTIGAEYVAHAYWGKMGFREILERLHFSEKEINIACLLVTARLIRPGSEISTLYFAKYHTALDELIDADFSSLSKNILYKTGDRLYENKEDIEAYLAKRAVNLFNLKEKIILYDLTNTYFEGIAEGNEKASFGRSKEKRSDCKLVVIGLVLDERGFPKASKYFKGNQSESLTLETMIDEMIRIRENKDEIPTIVIDAGIVSEKNIEKLKEKRLFYIAVHKGKAPFEIEEDISFKTIREDKSKGVKIEIKRYEIEDEIYLLCQSEKKQRKEKGIKTRIERLFLEKLNRLSQMIEKGRIKNEKKIYERLGRLKEKYAKAAKHYETFLEKDKDKPKIIYKKKEIKEKPPGSYILRTNRTDLGEEEIWSIYTMLTRIEDAFRSLKSELGLRPVYHQKEDRVDAHIFISILAYHISHAIEETLRKKGDHHKWSTIREILSTHTRVTVGLNTEQGLGYHIRVCTTPEAHHLDIYEKLGLSSIPLPKRRVVIGKIKRSDHKNP